MSTEPIEFSDTPLWTQFNSGAHKLSDDACTNFSSLQVTLDFKALGLKTDLQGSRTENRPSTSSRGSRPGKWREEQCNSAAMLGCQRGRPTHSLRIECAPCGRKGAHGAHG